MKIVLVSPYRGAGYGFKPEEELYYQEIIASMKRKGQLENVEVEIDSSQGLHTDHAAETRDEELFDIVTVRVLKRIREISDAGKHDGIILLGAIDFGFYAGRMISKLPIAHPLNSALHIASLIGSRVSVIDITDPLAWRQRRLVKSYGFDEKVVSIRTIGYTSQRLSQHLREYLKSGRTVHPEIERVLANVMLQCLAAIEKERVDTLVLGFTPIQALENEIRQRLDGAGYGEIPIVWVLPASIAAVKSLIEMKLMPAARAYPNDSLKSLPEFR